MADAGARPAPQVSGRAIAVLILGIASLVSCFPVPGIGAILLAPGARRQIAASGGTLAGGPLIRIGVACGWASLVLTAVIVTGLVALLAIRN